MEDLTWKDVFDASKKDWNGINAIADFIDDAGYEYFAFKEKIYDVYGNYIKMTTKDLV
tara:strand:+ start:501 stop:674 length:174 start_codon:yes stop_codon:yes gene_type:complete